MQNFTSSFVLGKIFCKALRKICVVFAQAFLRSMLCLLRSTLRKTCDEKNHILKKLFQNFLTYFLTCDPFFLFLRASIFFGAYSDKKFPMELVPQFLVRVPVSRKVFLDYS